MIQDRTTIFGSVVSNFSYTYYSKDESRFHFRVVEPVAPGYVFSLGLPIMEIPMMLHSDECSKGSKALIYVSL